MGDFLRSQWHLEKALALYDPISHGSLIHEYGTHPQAAAQVELGMATFILGYPDQALAQSSAAITEARRSAHPPSLANILAVHDIVLSLIGDDAALNERADDLVAVATEQGFPLWQALGASFRGWVKIKRGDVPEGMSLLRSGSAALRATGAEILVPYSLALLAMAYEITGHIAEAQPQLDEALQVVDRTGERWFAAELYRHKGQLLLRQGQPEAAETLYRKALGVAREQEAKLWELRAAGSLAQLWRDQGRRSEARDLLAQIYGWFTEGFDTLDLKDAGALLDELSA